MNQIPSNFDFEFSFWQFWLCVKSFAEHNSASWFIIITVDEVVSIVVKLPLAFYYLVTDSSRFLVISRLMHFHAQNINVPWPLAIFLNPSLFSQEPCPPSLFFLNYCDVYLTWSKDFGFQDVIQLMSQYFSTFSACRISVLTIVHPLVSSILIVVL